MRKSIWTAILLLVGMVSVLQSARSQEVTANIVGTVTDPSGAPVKGASVVATDVDRGTTWNDATNDAGVSDIDPQGPRPIIDRRYEGD